MSWSGAKALATPPARIVFDVTHHPTRIHVVEALRGKSGFLTLTRLVVESYEREEYLLFSGFDDDGARSTRRRWRSSSAVRAVWRAETPIPSM